MLNDGLGTEVNEGGYPVKNASYWRRKYRELEKRYFELSTELADLRDWQEKAFEAYPNLDLDIETICGPNVALSGRPLAADPLEDTVIRQEQ